MDFDGRTRESFFTRQTALWVSGVYLVFGVAYIYVSGWIVLGMFDSPAAIARAEMYKGWVFIFSSSVLVFVLIHFAAKALRSAARKEIEAVSQYERMIETTNEGVWKIAANGRTQFVNKTMADMLGMPREELIGQPEATVLDEHWSAVVLEHLQRQREGKRDIFECCFRRRDGSELWAVIAAAPMYDADGQFTGVLRMVTDISKRREVELALKQSIAAQRQLLDELDHRVRNNLTSLISLIDISRSATDNADAFASSIRGRIDAMSRVHGLLSSTGWQHQDLAGLLGVLVPDAYRGRISFSGPEVQCPASTSGAVAIVLHELLMNAVRHGALSSPQGRVDVAWSASEHSGDVKQICLRWRESGGPKPDKTARPNAGLRLVEGLVRTDLRGKADFNFDHNGVEHHLTLTFRSAAPHKRAHAMAGIRFANVP